MIVPILITMVAVLCFISSSAWGNRNSISGSIFNSNGMVSMAFCISAATHFRLNPDTQFPGGSVTLFTLLVCVTNLIALGPSFNHFFTPKEENSILLAHRISASVVIIALCAGV